MSVPNGQRLPRSGAARRPIGYLLKMYPRFSETFVLNEILELERQGVDLRIFSLKEPNDGIVHADVSRVRAPVAYVGRPRDALAIARAHTRVFRRSPRRYRAALRAVAARPRPSSVKHFVRAGVIADHVQREHIGHLHAHFASTAASVAIQVHRLCGVPYSVTAHAKDIYRHALDLEHLRTKLRHARFAVTVSEFNRRRLAELGRPDAERVYNGLDLRRFAPNGRRRDDPPLVLAVGRLVEKKGFDVLIRACAHLRDDGTSFRCAIVGKGDQEGALRGLVERLGLRDYVELTGPLPRETLLELFPRASVVAAPCVVGRDGNRDGLPTVLIEAMALRIPVVATPVTGIPELVEHGRTGLIVPERDARALADAIRRLLLEPETTRRLADAARERVERDFDLQQNVARLRSLFEESATR
jgi:colanic acid/amylovoran biosynthesis glycosyltransferase